MSWRVSLRKAAAIDLREAYEWYEKQQPGLGAEFLVSLGEAMARLESDPHIFPLYYRGFRRALTERFPYRVFFRIEGDAVIVFRVLHGARHHPRYLKNKQL